MLVCSQDSTFEHLCPRHLHCTPVAAARQAMASLPPEPAEGCTLRVIIEPRTAPRRLERKFDGDDTGAMVLRWLAAEAAPTASRTGGYTASTCTRRSSSKRPSTQTLQSAGLWPPARQLRPRPTRRITVRTARSQDGECLLECFADDTHQICAARVREAASFCSTLQARDWACRLVYAGKIIEGLGDVDQQATLFLRRRHLPQRRSRQE